MASVAAAVFDRPANAEVELPPTDEAAGEEEEHLDKLVPAGAIVWGVRDDHVLDEARIMCTSCARVDIKCCAHVHTTSCAQMRTTGCA